MPQWRSRRWWEASVSRSDVPSPRSPVSFNRSSSVMALWSGVGLKMMLVSSSGLGLAVMSHFLKTSIRDICWRPGLQAVTRALASTSSYQPHN